MCRSPNSSANHGLADGTRSVPATFVGHVKKARRIARQLNLPVTGTVALMIQAKQRGLIDSLSEVFDELTSVGFFLSDSLAAAALRQVGE